jgi:hypothetical protein
MATHPDETERVTLEDLYVQLDAAIDAVTTLAVTAIALPLPVGLVKVPEAALARLMQFKATVNPGPDPEGGF